MPLSRKRLCWILRPALIVANLVTRAALAATGSLIWLERDWVTPDISRSPEPDFREGTIATELMPLRVAEVLPMLFTDHFLPAGSGAGNWVEQFDFLRLGEPQSDEALSLPLGLAATHYRPGSGAPSPVPFIGVSCALCHTTLIRTAEDQPGRLVYGPGSVSLNLFGWRDAFQAALLDREPLPRGKEADPGNPPPYRMTLATVREAYRNAKGRDLELAERAMVALWLRQFQTRLEASLPRFDEPFGEGLSREPQVTPTGPTRTQPFRTLIRQVLEHPGNDLGICTKIATVFSEDLRERAQFDGTISDVYARSSPAALAAGATVETCATQR